MLRLRAFGQFVFGQRRAAKHAQLRIEATGTVARMNIATMTRTGQVVFGC